MTKLKKLFTVLEQISKNPALLNLILNRNENWKDKFAKTYGHTEYLPHVNLHQLSDNQDFELPYYSFLGGGSLPTDLILLRILCQQFSNCKYFEIGTWRGESAINVADITELCYSLNLSKKEFEDLGLPPEYIEAQAFLSKDNPRITHLEGDSKKFDFSALNQKFDVIFIDGNHDYDYVLSDTKRVFEHLVHENSVVVWHDYAYSPESIRYEVYKAIMDAIPKSNHENLYHVANTMCAIYTTKKLESIELVTPVNPEVLYRIKIQSRNISELKNLRKN